MSSERKQEIEAKFIVEDHSTAKELGVAQALSDLYSLGPVQEGEYVDHYLDTADYRLLRRGYSLRLRAVGEKRLVTLKSLKVRDQAQAHSRLEIEEAIAADFAPHGLSNLPKSIRATLRRAAGKDPQWRVLCTIEQERLKRPVFKVAAAAQPIAELSLDLVAIFAGERTPESTLVDLVAEVEVELLPGFEAAEIEPIVQALGSRPDLRAGATSKLEYALAMVSRSQPITPEMAVSEACRLIWRVQLTEMLLNEFGVRTSQDIEYVHAMRVAVRRMRSAGLLFGGFFQRSAVRTYLKELRKLTRQLGAVRDLDVLERHRASFVHHQGQFMGGKGLARQWRNSRKGHHAALLTWLDSEAYSQFVASFADFCQSPGVGTAPNEKAGALLEPTQVRHVLPGMIVARFERVRAYEALFDTGADVSIDHLHGLRIECKHLRYLLEFFRHLLGEEGALLIAQLKKLQDHLGDLNDAAVRQERVALASGKVAKAFKSEPDATVDRLRQTFPEVFRTFVGVENREALARAMARL